MLFAVLFFTLAFSSVFISFSNGTKTQDKYSDEEDEFIVEQLEVCIRLYNHNMWKAIAEAHEKKVKDKAPGFSKKRSANALRKHVGCSKKFKASYVSDGVTLLRHEVNSKAYSREEDELINTELPSLQGCIQSDEIWTEIEKKHDEKRESGFPGFRKKRTAGALRAHYMKTMVRKGHIDEAIKQKYPNYFKNRGGKSHLIGSAAIKEADQSDAGLSNTMTQCSGQEAQFIIDMLVSHASMYDEGIWNVMEEAYKNEVAAKTPGFSTPKPAYVLRQNFIAIMKYKQIKVPATVKKFYIERMSNYYSKEEHDFINTELLSWRGGIFGESIWFEMEKRHDEKRQSGCFGFHNKRTWKALYTHFLKRMVRKGLVSDVVKRKFPEYFSIERGKKKSVTDTAEYEESNPGEKEEVWESNRVEREEVWDSILDDLAKSQRGPVKLMKLTQVDDFGIDHSLFLDQNAPANLFELSSPHETPSFESMSPSSAMSSREDYTR